MRTRLPVAGEKQKSGFFDSSVSRNGTRGENEIGVDCVHVFSNSPRDNKHARDSEYTLHEGSAENKSNYSRVLRVSHVRVYFARAFVSRRNEGLPAV